MRSINNDYPKFQKNNRSNVYYVQFCLSVDIREDAKPLEPTKRCVGLDVGLKVFYANSDGETVEIPQYYQPAEKRLNRLNRKKSKKFRKGQPQSNNYQRARKRYARKHLRVSRQRRGFVEKEALRVIKSNDFIENFGSETPSFYDGFTVKYEHRLRNIC